MLGCISRSFRLSLLRTSSPFSEETDSDRSGAEPDRSLDAPPLPPQILESELKAAKAYMDHCDAQRNAPFDWAPGGKLYDALLQSTLVGKSSNAAVQ